MLVADRQSLQVIGAVAQLGEHLVCNQGVAGSIPVRSIERQKNRRQLQNRE